MESLLSSNGLAVIGRLAAAGNRPSVVIVTCPRFSSESDATKHTSGILHVLFQRFSFILSPLLVLVCLLFSAKLELRTQKAEACLRCICYNSINANFSDVLMASLEAVTASLSSASKDGLNMQTKNPRDCNHEAVCDPNDT